jgi:hypothetical protein
LKFFLSFSVFVFHFYSSYLFHFSSSSFFIIFFSFQSSFFFCFIFNVLTVISLFERTCAVLLVKKKR